MYPDSVSVVSSSFGWLTLTTRTRTSWTVRSLGALSSRARRSTSCRTSPDTAISTGISSSSPRSAGGRMRSLRTSVLACAAMSLTSFCSSDAATAGVAEVRNLAETSLRRSVVLLSSASITPLRAIRSRFFCSTSSRAGTRSPARRVASRIGSTTNDQPPITTATASPAAMIVRSRRERLAIMDGGLQARRAVACPASAAWGSRRRRVPAAPRRAWGAPPSGTGTAARRRRPPLAPDLPGGADAELLPVTSPCDGRCEFDALEQRGVLEDRDHRARLRRLAGQLDALGVEGEHREPGVTGEDLGQLAKHGQGPDRARFDGLNRGEERAL